MISSRITGIHVSLFAAGPGLVTFMRDVTKPIYLTWISELEVPRPEVLQKENMYHMTPDSLRRLLDVLTRRTGREALDDDG